MTVTYTAQVASCKRFGCFWKLLFRWKGSIYKLLWPNLTVYIMMYSTLSICYRFLLDEHQKTIFEKLSVHCQTYGDLIPVSFVLGFYISIVVKRWWDQYLSIPWPDPLAVLVSAFVWGQDERSRLMRRTVIRYANLSLVITLRMMCPTVKKRFPTLDHMVEAGFMLPNEKKMFDKLEERTLHPKYWLPLVWSIHILNTARREDRIRDDFGLNTLINGVNTFRAGCGSLLNYDWISIPLVYSQVVTLAVYTYFLATLMGNQYLNPTKGYSNHTIDLVVPIFTLLQFFFYMGWLLVAETLVNPFGEDDDDFEVNWLIDRNLQVSYLIVDEVHEEYPELVKDQYWEEVIPTELPYTEAAKQYYTEPFLGSTQNVDVPLDQRGFILMSMLNEPDVPLKTVSIIETTPVQILPVLLPNIDLNSNTSSPEDKRKSSNSILDLLKKNIYGDNSKRSISSDTVTVRQKSIAISHKSGSLGYSVASTFRRNFNDFPEDIFWMSDFSLAEPRSKLLKAPPTGTDLDSGQLINNVFPLDKFPCTVENLQSQSVKTQSVKPYEKMKQIAKSWHGQGLSNGQGQGEQFIRGMKMQLTNNLGLASSLCHTLNSQNNLAARSQLSFLDVELPSPSLAVINPLDTINKGTPLNDQTSKESLRKLANKEEEIVPLDQQILLEDQTNPCRSNIVPEPERIDETELECPKVHFENESTKQSLSNEVELRKLDASIKYRNISPNLIDKKAFDVDESHLNVSDPISFEKPAPTPAIVIPGSIMQNDHLSLPVLEHEPSQAHTFNESPIINLVINENADAYPPCPGEDTTDQNA
ncbi:uncharacterized protein LOC106665333 isoform X2 [Cimex lectularius]|uniref:Bestrophin homolog n=1 Tax=Cimex lectularius TaxID=79782 RepID=A0A8I6RL37_CIMLE|nr:uncharacterized protein LOC106665333 isoform X2 [Cimex lectularius]